jgi:hypothetical protein
MRLRRTSLLALTLLLPLLLALCGPMSASRAATANLSNGCTYSARGIPSCGALLGGAYGANADVKPWETAMGKNLGVHRTFWGSGSVSSAVKTATADVAAHRVGWLSFTAPYSWADMAAGKGDAWAKDLATRMKAAGGPVWVAVDHEPENDSGDIQKWKAMQARLAPIMRAADPNLGYSIILMGYHEFFGDKKYALSAIWPKTTIDVAGFDIYEKYGVQKSGSPTVTEWKNFDSYFTKIQQWSDSSGVAWGLAETGYSDPAAAKKPSWISDTFADLESYGGIAFSYFNTNLHSQANWALSNATKKNAFTAANKSAPTMQ